MKSKNIELYRPMRAIARRDWLVERAEAEVVAALDYLEARVRAMRGTLGFPKVDARVVKGDILPAASRFEAAIVAADTARQWHAHFNRGLDAEITVPCTESSPSGDAVRLSVDGFPS